MAGGVLLAMFMLSVLLVHHIKRGGKRTVMSMQKVVVINYFQLMYMIANLDVPWPEPLEILFDVEGAISTIGEHLLNPECEVTEVSAAEMIYFKQVGYMFSLPVLISLSQAFWYVHAWCQGRAFRYRGVNRRSPSHKDASVATVVFLLYLLYPTLCRQAFALLICKSVGTKSYMLLDLQEECWSWSSRHFTYIMMCTVPQIVLHVFGIPILGLRAVWQNIGGKKRQRRGSIRRVRKNRHASISLFRYGMLYNSYNSKRWYWGAVVASRKAVIAFITRTSLLEDPALEVHWVILYLALSIMGNMAAQQHVGAVGVAENDATFLQLLDSISLFLLLFTAWSGLFFNLTPTCGKDEIYCLLTLLVVFSVNLLFFLYCIYLMRGYIKASVEAVFCYPCRKFRTARGVGEVQKKKSVHLNPLVYRTTLVKDQVFENPLKVALEGSGGRDLIENPLRRYPRSRSMEEEDKIIELRRIRAASSADRRRKIEKLTSLKKQKMLKLLKEGKSGKAGKDGMEVAGMEGPPNWIKAVDPETGKFYYYDEASGKAVWEQPKNVAEV
jgi:hypothetical protein